ncbi:AraC family transcriptional regulator [Paenibacillus motobuensis]|uniref:AraC family transcriptional regulator n=1 Tax=Paenibacillus motobuensis TaxID=295324 RepID=A0ABN0XY72_9BACL
MEFYQFKVERPLTMNMAGKFTAPSPEWMHIQRTLMDFELFIPTQGSLYIANDRDHYELREGDFLLMSPGMYQYGYRSSDCSFYWLHFTVQDDFEVLRDLADYAYEPCLVVIPETGTVRSSDKLIVLMKQLQDSVRSYREQTLSNYMATTILCELFNQLFVVRKQTGQKLKQQQLYNDIADYIQWHKYENLRVARLAEDFGYNAKYLSSLFTKIAGISLKQYILQEKMEAAKSLLTDTNQSVNEIAMQLGYPDSHQFMKSFKKITGLTPTDYRNAYANRLLYYK